MVETVFEAGQGRVYHGATSGQFLNERLHGCAIEVELPSAFAHHGEAGVGARVFFGTGHEVQEQHVQMVQFVVALRNDPRGGGEGGNMTTHL